MHTEQLGMLKRRLLKRHDALRQMLVESADASRPVALDPSWLQHDPSATRCVACAKGH